MNKKNNLPLILSFSEKQKEEKRSRVNIFYDENRKVSILRKGSRDIPLAYLSSPVVNLETITEVKVRKEFHDYDVENLNLELLTKTAAHKESDDHHLNNLDLQLLTKTNQRKESDDIGLDDSFLETFNRKNMVS